MPSVLALFGCPAFGRNDQNSPQLAPGSPRCSRSDLPGTAVDDPHRPQSSPDRRKDDKANVYSRVRRVNFGDVTVVFSNRFDQ